MSNEDPTGAGAPIPSRRTPRQGAGGAPLGSTVSIVLAVVAVVVGFLILNNITGNDSSAGGSSEPGDSVPVDTTGIDLGGTASTSSTEPPIVTAGATVVVANASGVQGSAGRMSLELGTQMFEMVDPPINSTLPSTEATVVQYDPANPAALAVAESVARVMGGLTVEPVGATIPVQGGSLDGAGVLVLLGTNEADKTIAQLSATVASVTPTGDATTTG